MSKFESYAHGTPCFSELITPDQEAAKHYYGQLFGWEFQDIPMDEGGVYLAATVAGDTVAGIGGQMPELAGHPAFWGVYLAVDDVDAATAKVEGAGGKIDAGPFDVKDLGRMSAIQDPSGARFCLWQAGTSVGSERANEPGAPIWHELITPDVPLATAFYAEVLGVAWESWPMEGGDDYTCLMVGGKPVGGAALPQIEGVPPHWDVYFNVEDCDAALARAVELGGKEVAPVVDVSGVGRMAMATDPQGGLFAFMQNPPESE